MNKINKPRHFVHFLNRGFVRYVKDTARAVFSACIDLEESLPNQASPSWKNKNGADKPRLLKSMASLSLRR